MEKSDLAKDLILLQSLSEGRQEVLDEIYYHYRLAFLHWAKRRFKATTNDLEDAWQDAVIALYERVVSPKPFQLRCSLRTYLFAIGNKRLLQNHRKMKRFFWKDEIDQALLQEPEIQSFDWEEPEKETRELLLVCIGALGSPCRDLLLSRYYDGAQLQDIQQKFDYQNLNTVSASISRCLRRLKSLVEEKLAL